MKGSKEGSILVHSFSDAAELLGFSKSHMAFIAQTGDCVNEAMRRFFGQDICRPIGSHLISCLYAPARITIATCDTRIVGCAVWLFDISPRVHKKPQALIQLLAAHPDFQRRGIGATLLAWCEQEINAAFARRHRETCAVRVWAPRADGQHRRLLRHHGYVVGDPHGNARFAGIDFPAEVHEREFPLGKATPLPPGFSFSPGVNP